jgi:hypothetical protein
LRDKLGRTYADLVAAGKRIGTKLNKNGWFMPISPGRKPGTKNKPKMENSAPTDTAKVADTTAASSTAENGAAGSPPPATPAPENPQMAEIRKLLADDAPSGGAAGGASVPAALKGDEYTMAAAGTVSMLSTVAILAMGAHVKPSDEQVAAMVDAYAAAYRHYGYKPSAPPWLAPVVTTVVWIGPHFADERSQTTLQKWKSKALNAWLWVQSKFAGRAAADAAGAAHR